MSATLTTPMLPFAAPGDRERLPRPRRLTLEQRLEGSLAELRTAGSTECPLCRAPMRPAADGGECSGCGSRLS
jgi:hypothetical protein